MFLANFVQHLNARDSYNNMVEVLPMEQSGIYERLPMRDT